MRWIEEEEILKLTGYRGRGLFHRALDKQCFDVDFGAEPAQVMKPSQAAFTITVQSPYMDHLGAIDAIA